MKRILLLCGVAVMLCSFTSIGMSADYLPAGNEFPSLISAKWRKHGGQPGGGFHLQIIELRFSRYETRCVFLCI